MQEFQKYLDELSHPLFAARRYLSLWWVLCGDARPQNVDIMNNYNHLFRSLIGCSFDAGIIALYKCIDQTPKTKSMYGLLKYLENNTKFTHNDISGYKTRLGAHDATMAGLKIIRGSAIGHLSEKGVYLEMFTKAKLTFGQLKALIDELIAIFCDIYRKQTAIIHDAWFNTKAAEELETLFQDLKAFHTAKRT